MVRIGVLNPFLEELRERGISYIAILEEFALPLDTPFSDDAFATASAVYGFVEMAASASRDPYFGARIGRKINLADLPQFSISSETSLNVGDLLTRLVKNSQHHSTSATLSLRIEANRSSFAFSRSQEPDVDPDHVDGFYVGMLHTVFSSALDQDWKASRVLAHVSNPAVIPPEFGPITMLQGDRRGIKISFPTDWLVQPFSRDRYFRRLKESAELSEPPTSLIDSVRRALAPHIHETDLTVERAARICGFDTRKLARKLKASDTTLSREISCLRQEKAENELSLTNRKIADIAFSVGFTDSTVFSRSFKNWTGQSPQAYRRNQTTQIVKENFK